MVPRKSVFFIIVKINRFGMVPNTALSMDSDCDPLETKSFEFDSGKVVSRGKPVASSYIMSSKNRGIRSDTFYTQVGI